MAKHVLARTRSTISSAQSWYNVCNVLRHPARSPRRNSVSYPAGSFSYSAWKVFRKNSPCATSLSIVSAFCIRCMVVIRSANCIRCASLRAIRKGQPFNEACPVYGGQSPLRGYSNVMEGRGDGFKCMNLGRSIDHSCKGSQHFWIGIGVVSVCIGFVLPQTDRNHIHAAGIRQCDFVLKALLLAK